MKCFLLALSLFFTLSLSAQRGKGIKKIGEKESYVSFISSDASGNVWIGLGGWKLFGYQRNNGGLKKYRDNQLTTVYATGAFSAALPVNDEIFFTSNNGLYNYKNDSLIHHDPFFTTGSSLTYYKNKVWVGTMGKGIYKYEKGVTTQVHVKVNGSNMDSVYSLCADGNILWIGTSRGLVRYQDTNFTLVNVPVVKMDSKLSQDRQLSIISMQMDGYGRLWMLNASNVDTIPCLYFMDKSEFRSAMSYYHEQCYEPGSVPSGGYNLSRTAWGHILMTTWWGVIEMTDKLYNHSFAPGIVGLSSIQVANSSGSTRSAGYTHETRDGKWYVNNEAGLMEINLSLYNQDPVSHNPYTNYFGRNNNIDINDINANICNDGTMFNRHDMWLALEHKPAFQTKSLGCAGTMFNAGLWMGGINNASGDLHLAAQTYRQKGFDYMPGPINTQTMATDTALASQFNQVWKIDRETIGDFLANRKKSGYQIPRAILDWPANPPANCIKSMAPYVDTDNNGIYEPIKGDYPKIKGDQMLWWVFNDIIQHYESEALPLRVQVNASCYAYKDIRLSPKDKNFLVNRSIFFDYTVHNLSGASYNDFYMGVFSDVDLGNFSDDYVGSDSADNVAFVFNASNIDKGPYGFGKNPPMIGCKFLNRKMSNVKFYNNDNSQFGNPRKPRDYYAYMKSAYYEGDSLIYHEKYTSQGYPCKHEPIIYGGDRRFLSSCNTPVLKPGESFNLEFAYILLHDPNIDFLKDSCNKPRQSFSQVQQWYDNNSFPSKPYWPASIENIQSAAWLIYPNPAQTVLNIQSATNNDLAGNIYVFDNTGKLVLHSTGNASTEQIDISTLANGIYMIRVLGHQQSYSGKFIKQN